VTTSWVEKVRIHSNAYRAVEVGGAHGQGNGPAHVRRSVRGPPLAGCTDRARGPGAEVVYENRVMLLVRAVWGKVVSQEDFLDTEKVAAFDRYLSLG
jgi:hypothetical protein